MTDNPLLQFGIAAAIITGIVILWRVTKGPMETNGQSANGKAGNESVETWRLMAREDQRNVLKEEVKPILERFAEAAEKQAQAAERQADAIERLELAMSRLIEKGKAATA